MITIDGREAGGQILRVALGLASILGKGVRITNIRGARPKPGLKTQHLEGVLAIGKLCDASINGARLWSREIEFRPRELRSKKLRIRISTAGSIGLLFQSLQLAAAFTEQGVEICTEGGGTVGKWAPPITYVQHVFLPLVAKMGYRAEVDVLRHGFYPKGGASVRITVHPIRKLSSLILDERGEVQEVRGVSLVGSLPARIASRQAHAAEDELRRAGLEAEIETRVVRTHSPGTCIVLWARTENSILGADAIGERGLPAERVGTAAARRLVKSVESNAALDLHMADQILPFLALADSFSRVSVESVTTHCLTNAGVIERLLPVKFSLDEDKGMISVKGVGLENKFLPKSSDA
jgi:RNA 3'-phosphate cyclase